MKKNLVVAAIAAALATPLVAQADATMYGQLRAATQNKTGGNNSWGMADQGSRLGVKGSEELGAGLKAIFQMEFGVDVGSGDGAGGKVASTTAVVNSNFLSQRNTFVGLAGDFGTLLMGRHDTPFKMSTMKLDFFVDTNVDFDNGLGSGAYTNSVGLFDSRRVSGAVAYVSPSIAGLTLMGAVVQTNAGEALGNTEGVDPAGAYSVAGTFNNGPLFASVGFENISAESLMGIGGAVPDYDKWRFGLGMVDFYRMSASFIYEDRTNTDNNRGVSTNSWQLQGAYEVMPGMKIKGMYGEFDGDVARNVANLRNNFNTWAFGMQQNFSKRTDIQVLYRKKDVDSTGVIVPDDDDVFAVQLDHSF